MTSDGTGDQAPQPLVEAAEADVHTLTHADDDPRIDLAEFPPGPTRSEEEYEIRRAERRYERQMGWD